MEIQEFFNVDGSFSHWSVCENDELCTCVMHDTYLSAWRELRQLDQ